MQMNMMHKKVDKGISLEDTLRQINENIKKNNELMNELLAKAREKEKDARESFVAASSNDSAVGAFVKRYLWCFPAIDYLIRRYEDSSLRHFVEGECLCSDDIDTIVNMLTLVQALLLTITPSFMLALQDDFWENLQQSIDQCNIPNSSNIWYNQVFVPLWGFIVASITAECLGLVLAVQYFVLRPKGVHHFTKWWKRGFYGVILLLSSIVATVFCTFICLVYFLNYLIVPDSELCAAIEQKSKTGRATALSPLETNSLITVIVFFCFIYCLGAFFFA
jgi:hypothetical protein